ncbi:MAG TPA: glycoside hydrolase family 32 protein [Draconibacterium sp.]|nr:glycoside hydrolase family 32 protein [Draconibacterium sp.]
MNFLSTTLLSVLLIISTFAYSQELNYEKQPLRPQFHFSPGKNWQGAPEGLVFLDGEYHLFYQYNPLSNEEGYSHWGHAVSSDLIHWNYLPIALSPDENSSEKDSSTVLSGSVIVDKNNVLGKQKGNTPTFVAFYTSDKSGQRLAYSNDKGLTWQKYEKNPIIAYDSTDDARDPKIFWNEETKKWVMLLSRKLSDSETSKGTSFYTSDNLIDWQFQSHLPGMFDHPDLVEFTVTNRPDEKVWILFDGTGSYLMGNFDGSTFTPTSGKMTSDWGKNYYAPQTWNNLPETEKRVLQIACLRNGTFTDMPFNGQMTFPSELSVKKFATGYKLIRKPIKEIELLHGKHDSWTDKNLIPGIKQNRMKNVNGDCLHIIAEFDLKTSDNFGFMLRHSTKNPGIEVLYNVKRGVLTVLGSTVPLLPVDNKIQLEIILDRTSLEIYANDGQAIVSNLYEADAKSKDVMLFTNGGELGIIQADAYEIKSIWNEK